MKYHILISQKDRISLPDVFPVVGEISDFRIVEVTDGQLDEVRAILISETGKAELKSAMIGEDHRRYVLTADQVVLATKYEKWPFTMREWEESFQKQNRQAAKEIAKRDALLQKHGGDARVERGSPLSFKPGYYFSKTHGLWFPYRVKYAKKPGQPLLVFFHGGGSVGTDNLRPLYEYKDGPYPEWFPWRKRAPLYKSDITVLIPQSTQSGAYEYHSCQIMRADRNESRYGYEPDFLHGRFLGRPRDVAFRLPVPELLRLRHSFDGCALSPGSAKPPDAGSPFAHEGPAHLGRAFGGRYRCFHRPR